MVLAVTRCCDYLQEVPAGVLRCDYHARDQMAAQFDADYSGRRSLHDVLAAAGYTSRPTPTTLATGRRAILREGGAEVVAELTSHEAWEWISRGGER